MGVLRPFCLATDGIRIYAISYAYDDSYDDGSNVGDYPYNGVFKKPQYVLVAQSNPYPNMINARRETNLLEQKHIQKVLTWKTAHVVRSDSFFSWFQNLDVYTRPSDYSCGATSAGAVGVDPALDKDGDDYVFTLHLTDKTLDNLPAKQDDPARKLLVIKFKSGQNDPEVIRDERPTVPKTPMEGATVVGTDGPRSALVPLDRKTGHRGGGDGPWVEALGLSKPSLIQLSTTLLDSSAFPALVQNVKSTPESPLAFALDDQKLHIMGRFGNCTELTTVKTAVVSNALVMAEEPSAQVSTPGFCFGNAEGRDHNVRLGVKGNSVYALGAESKGWSDGVISYLQRFNSDAMMSTAYILDNYWEDLHSSDMRSLLSLIPLTSSKNGIDFKPLDPGEQPQEEEMSFLTGHPGSLLLIARQSPFTDTYSAIPFNLTVQEPYKYFSFRDPELLTKSQIGGIAAGGALGLIALLLVGWRFYRRRRNRRKEREQMAGMELKETYVEDRVALQEEMEYSKEEETEEEMEEKI